jgi:hypothetical protein
MTEPSSEFLGAREALALAQEKGLDLVEVSPTARPPVCRIMDYGKFKYEQSKRERKARKKQHVMHLKEVKLRPKVAEHDYDFKVEHARQFLEKRDKVKFTVTFPRTRDGAPGARPPDAAAGDRRPRRDRLARSRFPERGPHAGDDHAAEGAEGARAARDACRSSVARGSRSGGEAGRQAEARTEAEGCRAEARDVNEGADGTA